MEVPNTIIIESNKKAATEQEFQSYIDGEVNTNSMPIDRSSSWKSYIEHGIQLDEGDSISIESSQINILGDANSTMEFTRGESAQGKDPLVDNRVALNLGYYITNKHQNNFPLPLFRQKIKINVTGADYGAPSLKNWSELSSALPIFAVEGSRYNPEYTKLSSDVTPQALASWYLGEGGRDKTDWFNQDPQIYLPWIQWIGHAPLQNGPYEIYKPNEMRLYKHKYIPFDKTEIARGGNSYYNITAFDYENIQTDSPYFDLTANIIDIEIPEGFTTPSSLGEFMTTSFNEIETNKNIEFVKTFDISKRIPVLKDAPAPSLFKFTGAWNTCRNAALHLPRPNIFTVGDGGSFAGGIPIPQVLERDAVDDTINKTFTTARTVGGTILEDYLAGNFTGSIQYPFVRETDPNENNRLFFSDILDGDVKKTSTAIKFSSFFKNNAKPTNDIIANKDYDYMSSTPVIDEGNTVPIGGQDVALYGSQVVILDDLPRKRLDYNTDEDSLPKPKFWLNKSGERECTLQDNNCPPTTTVTVGSETNIKTVYNSLWRTCPPVAAEGLQCLDMKPFDLIPTNIVANRVGIALLKRVFNTGQYIQDNKTIDAANNRITPTTKDNLLRRRAVDNKNIIDKLVVKFQVGATDDSITTTEAYYSTNQINLICPTMVTYYTNPAFNIPLSEHFDYQGLQKLNGGKANESYMVLGRYNYTIPQLDGAPTQMPVYSVGEGAVDGSVGKWSELAYHMEVGGVATPEGFPRNMDIPRLIGRCWWNKNVLDDCVITPNIRTGYGAVFPYSLADESDKRDIGLDIDSQKKGQDAKYNIELKTSWDDRLDPQSPNFKCRLLGKDGTEASSRFQFKCSVTDEYFDVTRLQGNVFDNVSKLPEFQGMTNENLQSIERSGIGIVVAYLKKEVLDQKLPNGHNNPLYYGEGFLKKDSEDILIIPYICFVNMSMLYPSDSTNNNQDLNNTDIVQIPVPCIGEIFGPSLSCQDNYWSKIVTTQKKQPNMRCSPVHRSVDFSVEGFDITKPYEPVTQTTAAQGADSDIDQAQFQMSRFRQNELLPPPDVYTYPSFQDTSGFFVNESGLRSSAFYHMVDYIPYVKIGSDNANITFDDNFGRFSLSSLHTPFYKGNKVNPHWVRLTSKGGTLSTDAIAAITPNEQFEDKIKAKNTFCAAISTYKAANSLTRVLCYNYADSLAVGSAYTEFSPCIPFSLVQSSSDVKAMQDTQSGIGLLNITVPYRNIRNPQQDFCSTKKSQNINNLLEQVQISGGIQNMANSVQETLGWKTMNPFNPVQYKETLFAKMGYSLEQLLPFFGNQNNTFNRNNYNLFEGYEKDICKKQQNMVIPFTTNCFISGTSSIDFTTNFSNMPMKNLGVARNKISISATAESDSLIAVSLPEKLAYSYLVVYSDILQTKSQYYGSSYLSTLPAIGYITRNYESADFFFSFSNDWQFYNDKKRTINEFTIDIRLPNGRKPPIADNSSILFKIVKKKLIGILKNKETNPKE